jgi:hypothetical protein
LLHLQKQIWTYTPTVFFGLHHFISAHKTPNGKEEEREEMSLSNQAMLWCEDLTNTK